MLSHDRLLDLLAARATEGLTADESRELEQALLGQEDFGVDDLDLAAAAVYLAYDAACPMTEPMPETLRRRILGPGLSGK